MASKAHWLDVQFLPEKKKKYYGLSFQTQNDRNVKVGSGGREGVEVIQPNPLAQCGDRQHNPFFLPPPQANAKEWMAGRVERRKRSAT